MMTNELIHTTYPLRARTSIVFTGSPRINLRYRPKSPTSSCSSYHYITAGSLIRRMHQPNPPPPPPSPPAAPAGPSPSLVGMAEATAATATAAALPTPMRSQSSVEPWQQNHHSSNEDDPFFPPSAGMGVRRTSTDPHALTTPDLSWLLLGDPSGGGGGGTAADATQQQHVRNLKWNGSNARRPAIRV